jgi:hypothetical protein
MSTFLAFDEFVRERERICCTSYFNFGCTCTVFIYSAPSGTRVYERKSCRHRSQSETEEGSKHHRQIQVTLMSTCGAIHKHHRQIQVNLMSTCGAMHTHHRQIQVNFDEHLRGSTELYSHALCYCVVCVDGYMHAYGCELVYPSSHVFVFVHS